MTFAGSSLKLVCLVLNKSLHRDETGMASLTLQGTTRLKDPFRHTNLKEFPGNLTPCW